MTYNRFIIERKLKEFLEEDCNFKDVTSSIISIDAEISAKILAKSEGYISGLEELKILFNLLKISSEFLKSDGDYIKNGDIIVNLKGKVHNLLLGERIGLNLITHMSAITTITRKYINIIKDSGKNVRVACTRKTMPGLRIFDKKAVEVAGGDTHRFNLDDMILLKDTHLKYYNGNVEKLLNDTKKIASFTKKIEIEIEKVDDVLIATKNGADIIMLDNFTPDEVEDAISLLKNNNLRNKVIIEVSGGINEENLLDYVIAEPDIISLGLITQKYAEYIDFSLKFD
ncbi:MAG: carboxylating nicotinate-nucleotide diphosphorylase [Candidatus Thorarchaeota archaeon]